MPAKRFLFLIALLIALAATVGCTPTPPPLPTPAPSPTPPPVFDQVDTPEHLIGSYVNAITLGDYPRAYGYWEANSQSLADFTNSWSNVTTLDAVILEPVWEEGAAGSQYAAISALWLIRHADNTQAVEKVCFVARRINPAMTDTPDVPTPWKIYSLSSTVVPNADAWQLPPLTCPD